MTPLETLRGLTLPAMREQVKELGDDVKEFVAELVVAVGGKKEKKEALEEEIARLQEENSRMRVQLQDETNDAEREAQREAGLKRLRECYEAHDEEGIARESQRYYAEWEEFGRKRLMMAEFHLEQLKRLVLPTQVSGVMIVVIDVMGCDMNGIYL